MLSLTLLFKYALVYTQIFLSSFYNGTILLAIRLATAVLHPFTSYTFRIQTTADNHEAAQALRDMIKTDGAGSWPPKASHRDSWPTALRPYHDIFLELAPLLPVDQVSTDDTINQARRVEYQTRLQKLLQERVDLSAVESILLAVEKGTDRSLLSESACNGLFACIGHLRHGFRYVPFYIYHA